MGLPTDTWGLIFEPPYREKLKGRVTCLNSQRELMATGLNYLGPLIGDTNPDRWRAARDLILRARPYWATFSNSPYIRDPAIGNIWVAQGYSNDMFRAREDARAAGRPFAIPRAPCWPWIVSSSAPRRDGRIWRSASSTSYAMAKMPPTPPT